MNYQESTNCCKYDVGEPSIAEKLNDHGMITCLTKQHDVKKINKIKNQKDFS